MMRNMMILFSFLSILLTVKFYSQTLEKAWWPSAEELKKIEAAMPDKPAVKPKKPRKVLVFSLAHKFYHNAIPFGKKAFEIMSRKTGAFEAVISDDISIFEPENLQQFDAVILNNAYIEMFIPLRKIILGYFDGLSEKEKNDVIEEDKKLKHSLANFITRGGGLVIVHAAIASFSDWSEYGKIAGARFDNHPWVDCKVTLKVDRPDHPATQAFKTPTFIVEEEIYQLKDPYSRDKLDVLLSLDTTKTDMNKEGIHRKDNDFAISWVKSYGQGRVFYCALGDSPDIYLNPVILRHYLDGIQFVMGDLN